MKDYQKILHELAANGSLRSLPHAVHQGKWIEQDGQRMLNLSSNDYLGLANDRDLRNDRRPDCGCGADGKAGSKGKAGFYLPVKDGSAFGGVPHDRRGSCRGG